MRIAIVGATGSIGSRLVPVLIERGDTVVAVSRSGRMIGSARAVRWDGAGPMPEGAFDGCDAVVNLAGATIATRWSDEVKQELVTSRVGLTERIVEAIGANGPRVLVNASAVGFYGDRDEPVVESAPPGRGFLADLCVRWERAALAAEDRGVRVVLLRTGIVLARDAGALPRMLTPARLGLGGPLGSGRQWFPWVHAADVVGAILHALDTPQLRGPINVVAPNIVRQREFAKALGSAINRPAVTTTPAFAMRLLFGEGAAVLLEGQRAVPEALRASGYQFAFPELERALDALV